MAKGWLRAIQSTPEISGAIRIAYLVDLNENTARALAEEFALTDAVIGTDLRAVLAETKADILFDIVIPQARFAVVEAGLDAGCYVLSEKPLAASMEEAATLVELAKKPAKFMLWCKTGGLLPVSGDCAAHWKTASLVT